MAVAIAIDVVPVLPGHGGPVIPVLPVPRLRPVARHVPLGASAHVSNLQPGKYHHWSVKHGKSIKIFAYILVLNLTSKSDETTRCQDCQITASERVSVNPHNKYFQTPVFSLARHTTIFVVTINIFLSNDAIFLCDVWSFLRWHKIFSLVPHHWSTPALSLAHTWNMQIN